MMLHIGCHLSSSKGFSAMVAHAQSIQADTFQFFTRNPRGGSAKALDPADVLEFKKRVKELNFAPLVAHAPYTLNACGADPRVRDFAEMAMKEDLEKMEMLQCAYYNFHPGSHVGQGIQKGIELIADLLSRLVHPGMKCMVLLETMSGKGSEVGSSFEELAEIMEKSRCPDSLGVCLDTCHVHDAGYDIAADPDGVLAEFDRVIGLSYLKAIHINDSKNPLGAHKDRHEVIGAGHLGRDAFVRLLTHPLLDGLPFILETPQPDLAGYGAEIKMLRELIK